MTADISFGGSLSFSFILAIIGSTGETSSAENIVYQLRDILDVFAAFASPDTQPIEIIMSLANTSPRPCSQIAAMQTVTPNPQSAGLDGRSLGNAPIVAHPSLFDSTFSTSQDSATTYTAPFVK
jgi:hypothetical protein